MLLGAPMLAGAWVRGGEEEPVWERERLVLNVTRWMGYTGRGRVLVGNAFRTGRSGLSVGIRRRVLGWRIWRGR